MWETPHVIKAPKAQQTSEPAEAMSAPCHKKIQEISLRRYPMERKIAISLIFASTDIVRTLKIPKPASRMIKEVVMATDIRNVRKSCSVLSSRSCQLVAPC